jgi:hypothetical protein
MTMYSLRQVFAAGTAAALWLGASAVPAAEIVEEFRWRGQIAGFGVQGRFSYDEAKVDANGVIRNDFTSFDVSFFAPDGSLLRTYHDNHTSFSGFNFAFDTGSRQILQDGTYNKADGFLIGAGDAALRGDPNPPPGLAFWSRPSDDKLPHLHVDDWTNEFGFPIGFSSHEDVAFLTRTTQQLIATGKVGANYVGNPAAGLNELGQRVTLVPTPPTPALLLAGVALLTRRAGAARAGRGA